MAKKNTLRYILLGLLSTQKMTGYDLNQAFKDEIGEFWQAKHSQIYPELTKMEQEGWISYEVEISGTKLEKKAYSITEAGKIELVNWLDTPSEALPVNRDEFVVKLYFINNMDDPHLLEVINNQYKLHEARLAHLERRKELIFSSQKEIDDNYGHFLILDHGLTRERDYVSWLSGIRDRIEKGS
ncbi:PadR family transcriptional regulator [Enterococcus sp. BWM-S5]|uniref:PadR family transcriptional regulator n=1 Tax=Enterococcus larvae TaxID=2794352 RepID=A0ABS4CNX7_9ENTE|nr:PadR family transcriptional regulator [Enterococcus larvae]MBP1048284.1 PadR family transcriptional regulator [Enterococcus larvae]